MMYIIIIQNCNSIPELLDAMYNSMQLHYFCSQEDLYKLRVI